MLTIGLILEQPCTVIVIQWGISMTGSVPILFRSENPLKFHNDSARWGADGYYGVYCPGGPNVTYKGRIYKPKLSLCPPGLELAQGA
jgi:hypothetical protein